jgi:predicted nuclease of predicted toxin-antitoxin system
MKIVADEGVDKSIVSHLRKLGYEVYYILEEKSGISDDSVLEIANSKKALLITLDTDFGELIFRLKEASHGVLLFRFSGLTKIEKLKIVENTINKHSHELLNSFTVVTKETIRIRKLP